MNRTSAISQDLVSTQWHAVYSYFDPDQAGERHFLETLMVGGNKPLKTGDSSGASDRIIRLMNQRFADRRAPCRLEGDRAGGYYIVWTG